MIARNLRVPLNTNPILLIFMTSRGYPIDFRLILTCPSLPLDPSPAEAQTRDLIVPKALHVAKTREYCAMARFTRAYGLFLVLPGTWIVAGKDGWPKMQI